MAKSLIQLLTDGNEQPLLCRVVGNDAGMPCVELYTGDGPNVSLMVSSVLTMTSL